MSSKLNLLRKCYLVILFGLCQYLSSCDQVLDANKRPRKLPPVDTSVMHPRKEWPSSNYGHNDTLTDILDLYDTFYRTKSGDTFFASLGKTVFNGAILKLPDQIFDGYAPMFVEHPLSFDDCKFIPRNRNGLITINEVYFDSSLSFEGSKFQTPIIQLIKCLFNGQVFLSEKNSDGERIFPDFLGCVFNKGLMVGQVEMFGSDKNLSRTDLDLSACTFSGTISVAGCQFDSSLIDLYGSTLPDTLDLSGFSTKVDLDLSGVEQNVNSGICQIILLNTDLSKIKMQYNYFHLYFPAYTDDPISNDAISSTYEGLLANFKKNGYDASYKKLDIEFKDWQGTNDLWQRINGIWWQYGYEKWRVLLWTILLLLTFSFVNLFIYDKLMHVYLIEELKLSKFTFSRFKAISVLEKFGVAIMYTSTIFFKLILDLKMIVFRRWGILLILFIEYAFGLLCIGYIINWILAK